MFEGVSFRFFSRLGNTFVLLLKHTQVASVISNRNGTVESKHRKRRIKTIISQSLRTLRMSTSIKRAWGPSGKPLKLQNPMTGDQFFQGGCRERDIWLHARKIVSILKYFRGKPSPVNLSVPQDLTRRVPTGIRNHVIHTGECIIRPTFRFKS